MVNLFGVLAAVTLFIGVAICRPDDAAQSTAQASTQPPSDSATVKSARENAPNASSASPNVALKSSNASSLPKPSTVSSGSVAPPVIAPNPRANDNITSKAPPKIPSPNAPVVALKAAATSAPKNSSSNASSVALAAAKISNVDDKINAIDSDDKNDGWEYENTTYVDTRRILYSKQVKSGARPYMVYLQLTKESAKAHKYRGWLCGGVIVDKDYVLTSAACVEDADRFYIVSGTIKFVDSFDYKSNDCVCRNRRKVVWKCIPKNYKFDFQDSIKWSSNDIAIVKTDRPFKLGVKEKGCDFATDLICYNNISRELEKPGTKAFIAGWGSGSNFREGVYRRQKEPHIPKNAKCLQEAKVCIMDNEQCAKKWAQKFRSIITQYMICTKDVMKRLSELCEKKYANCTDVERRLLSQDTSPADQNVLNVDLGRHLRDPDDYTARRSSLTGGFCENDHGGPLIVKYQGKDRVIGVISACKIDPKTHSCHGPFLYTSVFKNRQFISCAINKDTEDNCRRVFRTGITHEEWSVNWDDYKEEDDVVKGEAKGERKEDAEVDDDDEDKLALRQKQEELKKEAEEGKKVEEEKIASNNGTAVESDTEESGEKSAPSSTTEKQKEIKKKRSKKNKKKVEKPQKKDAKKAGRSRDDSAENKGAVIYDSSHDDAVNDPGPE